MATNGQVFGIDKFIHRKDGEMFSQDAWSKAFSKAWNFYLKTGRDKHLRGFYDWCEQEYEDDAEENAQSPA